MRERTILRILFVTISSKILGITLIMLMGLYFQHLFCRRFEMGVTRLVFQDVGNKPDFKDL